MKNRFVVCLLALTVTAACASPQTASESAAAPVATTAGKSRGVLDEGVHTFKGIPYGRADQWQ